MTVTEPVIIIDQPPRSENQEFRRIARKFRRRNILKYTGIALGTATIAFGAWFGMTQISRPVPYEPGLVSVIDDGNSGFLKIGDRNIDGMGSFTQFDTSGDQVSQVLYVYFRDSFWTRHFATDNAKLGGNLTWLNIHDDWERWPAGMGGLTGEFYDGERPPISKVYYLNNPNERPSDVFVSGLTEEQIQAMDPVLVWER